MPTVPSVPVLWPPPPAQCDNTTRSRFTGCGSDTVPGREELGGTGSATFATIPGKIISVDWSKSLVTLVEGPGGKNVTLEVRNPYLSAAKPGEPFAARFYEIATFRKKHPAASTMPELVSAMLGQKAGGAVDSSEQVLGK